MTQPGNSAPRRRRDRPEPLSASLLLRLTERDMGRLRDMAETVGQKPGQFAREALLSALEVQDIQIRLDQMEAAFARCIALWQEKRELRIPESRAGRRATATTAPVAVVELERLS